jgi:hypothetical protein
MSLPLQLHVGSLRTLSVSIISTQKILAPFASVGKGAVTVVARLLSQREPLTYCCTQQRGLLANGAESVLHPASGGLFLVSNSHII